MDAASSLELIRRGASEIITEGELRSKLSRKQPLTIKAGFDPTAPDLHLGHTVLLRKLRQFQTLNHKVVFLIGDSTARVGDPSGQSKTRKLMRDEDILSNARTYKHQVGKILNVSDPSLFELRYNSEWFCSAKAAFGLNEILGLTSRYTVARLIERDDFRKRLSDGQELSMLELLYPLMQGYDSVMLKSDVELGGTDQKFNLLVGRDLQRSYAQEPQIVITLPLLEGTDGIQKMSKSLGNHIGINEPAFEMFGKLMSIPDSLIIKYFTLLTDVAASRISELEQKLLSRKLNPRDAKAELAETIVAMYHDSSIAKSSRDEFDKVFSRRESPTQMLAISLKPGEAKTLDIVDLLAAHKLAKTKNEARRLLSQGAVKLNGAVVKKHLLSITESGIILQVGSRHFRRLLISGGG